MSERRMSLSEALTHIRNVSPRDTDAFKVLREALERGELRATAVTWGPEDYQSAIGAGRSPIVIPNAAWGDDCELVSEEAGVIRCPKYWSNPQSGYDYSHRVHLSQSDVERLWPLRTPEQVKNAGGRPLKWDWEGAIIEMARVAVFEENTDRKALTDAVNEWFVRAAGDSPASGEVRARVKRFHETLWPPKS